MRGSRVTLLRDNCKSWNNPPLASGPDQRPWFLFRVESAPTSHRVARCGCKSLARGNHGVVHHATRPVDTTCARGEPWDNHPRTRNEGFRSEGTLGDSDRSASVRGSGGGVDGTSTGPKHKDDMGGGRAAELSRDERHLELTSNGRGGKEPGGGQEGVGHKHRRRGTSTRIREPRYPVRDKRGLRCEQSLCWHLDVKLPSDMKQQSGAAPCTGCDGNKIRGPIRAAGNGC